MTYEDLSADKFLHAKYGNDLETNIEIYPEGHDRGSSGTCLSVNLTDLLEEFAQLIVAEDVQVLKNPRTEYYTAVDKTKGEIIGSYEHGEILLEEGYNETLGSHIKV